MTARRARPLHHARGRRGRGQIGAGAAPRRGSGALGLDVVPRASPAARRTPKRCAKSSCPALRERFGPAAEAMLFAAARIDHIDGRSGRRSSAAHGWSRTASPNSTRAYQGAAGSSGAGFIDRLEAVAVGDEPPRPDADPRSCPRAGPRARRRAARGRGRRIGSSARGWSFMRRCAAPSSPSRRRSRSAAW